MFKTEYRQEYVNSLDMTFIFKREYNGNGAKEFISGFYYGKPNESGFNEFKDKNYIYLDNDYLEYEKEDLEKEENRDMEELCKDLVNKLLSKKETYIYYLDSIMYDNIVDDLSAEDLKEINKYRNKIKRIYTIVNYIDNEIRELDKE